MMSVRERIRDISVALGQWSLAEAQSLEPILADIRELTELESIALYSLASRNGQWELTRFEAAGSVIDAGPALRRLFRERPFPLYFEPPSPPREQRNKVVDSIAWLERNKPGCWEQNAMHVKVLRPLGLHWHRQPRALLYEGSVQLAWFGALHPTAASSRQLAILSALVRPMHRRLSVERRIFGTPYLAAALATTLERLGAPAFIINARGVVCETNKPGEALLSTRGDVLVDQLREVLLGLPDPSIELIPISREGETAFYLAVMREASPNARIAACLDACQARWRFTKRQREVLALVVAGLSNAAIARELGCVERTVELHVSALLDRAVVDSRAGLVTKVLTALP
jgi:DNA-binding CsgD family transcriptional regulator